MNKTLRTKSSNNRIVILLMIIGLFALFMSGCGQPAEPVKNATNAAPTNAAPTNAAPSANSEAPKANTNSEASKASESKPGGACSGEPTDYEVFLYTEKDYQGSCAKISAAKTGTEGPYDPGVYRNPAALGITNDTTVSVKIGKKVRATLCRDDDFKGFCFTQTGNVAGFSSAESNPNVPKLDKTISSVIVIVDNAGVTLTVTNNSDKNLATFEKIQGVGYAFDSYLGNLGSKTSSKYVSYQGMNIDFQEYSAERKMFISQEGYRVDAPGDKTVKIENGGGRHTNIQVVQ